MLDPFHRAALKLNAAIWAPAEWRSAVLKRFGAAALEASAMDWAAEGDGTSPERVQTAYAAAKAFDVDAELELAQRLGVRIVFRGEAGYPSSLGEVPDGPLALYWKGEPAREPYCGLAVVGARFCSVHGKRVSERLGGDAAAAGLTVVSGLARGIDAAAHRGALEREGTTWAVLGNGLADIYPPEHSPLAAEIVDKGGAIVSAVPLRERVRKETFRLRNRVMAALSFATVVVEGAHGSGVRSTGEAAVEYARELYAVPGLAGERLSELPHYFLRHTGATLAESFRDIAPGLPEPYNALSSNRKTLPRMPTLSRDLEKVLQCIGPHGSSLEELQSATGLDLPRLSTIIFELEIQQIIDSIPGQRYAKKRHFENRQH